MNHTNNHVCIVPSSAAMSRFIKKLKEHQEELTEMMLILEKKVQEKLPDFGKEVAVDGKIIQSYANKV